MTPILGIARKRLERGFSFLRPFSTPHAADDECRWIHDVSSFSLCVPTRLRGLVLDVTRLEECVYSAHQNYPSQANGVFLHGSAILAADERLLHDVACHAEISAGPRTTREFYPQDDLSSLPHSKEASCDFRLNHPITVCLYSHAPMHLRAERWRYLGLIPKTKHLGSRKDSLATLAFSSLSDIDQHFVIYLFRYHTYCRTFSK